MRSKGLNRDRLRKFLELLYEVLVDATGRRDLRLVKNVAWLRDNVDRLPLGLLTTFQKLKEILKSLRELPRPRHLLREILDLQLPELPTIPEIVEDVEVVTESLIKELRDHTRTLIVLFDTLRPEAMPYVLKLIEENPVNLRSTFGEVLGIWWYTRVRAQELAEGGGRIVATAGPLRFMDEEIDALVAISRGEELELYLAEVKNSRNEVEVLGAARHQLARKAQFLEAHGLELLEGALGVRTRGRPKVAEKALVTLYKLGSSLRDMLEREGARVYDANDIVEILGKWKYRERSRYVELFTAAVKLLEGLR